MEDVPVINKMDTSAKYSADELKAALFRLNTVAADSTTDIDHDCRHIFGYKDPSNHKLSMLQTVTATLALDYERYLSSQKKSAAAPDVDELLRQAAAFQQEHGDILNLQSVIQSIAPRMALAAEFKRASPSKGDIISKEISAGDQAVKYATAGANIISVLTEARWFKGTLQDLTQVRLQTTTAAASASAKQQQQRPAVLRKEFVTHTYMIAEAAAAGADTVLLIVAVLPQSLLQQLIDYCRNTCRMEPLVEVHADTELDVALAAGAKVIGVNNRNLHTFQVDMGTSERVAQQLTQRGLSFFRHDSDPKSTLPEYTLCALSGMSTCYDVDRYRRAGLGMCLIGESLMRANDPAAAISSLCLDPVDFVKQQQQQSSSRTGGLSSSGGGGAYTGGTQIIKVCGITNVDDALVACRAGANLIGVIFANKSQRKVTTQQASDVVTAVRQFGERNQRTDFFRNTNNNASSSSDNTNNNDSCSNRAPPLPHLVSCAQALVEGSRKRPAVVGVFQNHDLDFVRQTVQACGLDLVQLHGTEGMAAANPSNFGGVPAIRVVDIAVDPATGKASKDAVAHIMESITNDPAAILLDTSIKGAKEGGGGGTGVSFDWTIAQRIQDAGLPVIIAGGLTPESVKDCVTGTRPFGVDVSSGVEKAPGLKDHDKVKEFVQGARAAAIEASKGF